MNYNNQTKGNCGCKHNIKSFGLCDVIRINLIGSDRTSLNWSEISIPELMSVPVQKPDIEHLDQVYVDAVLECVKLIETPYSYQSYQRLATASEITTAPILKLDCESVFSFILNYLTNSS